MSTIFNKELSRSYDERNSKLAPISDGMHFLIRLILKELPAQSRVLCVGVGTGAEVLSLSSAYPEWRFVCLDPSADMLDVCRERLKGAGVLDRCELVHGYIQDLTSTEPFDAALSVLVGHFVQRDARLAFYREIIHHLRTGGLFVNCEVSFDLDSPELSSMLKCWEQVQRLTGAPTESITSLPMQLRDMLVVLPPAETENLLRQSGIPLPVRFFQAFLIAGWYGRRA